jgi:hypothetical protein
MTKAIVVPESSAGARFTAGATAGGESTWAGIPARDDATASGANGSGALLGMTRPIAVPESSAGARLTGGAGAGGAALVVDDGAPVGPMNGNAARSAEMSTVIVAVSGLSAGATGAAVAGCTVCDGAAGIK